VRPKYSGYFAELHAHGLANNPSNVLTVDRQMLRFRTQCKMSNFDNSKVTSVVNVFNNKKFIRR